MNIITGSLKIAWIRGLEKNANRNKSEGDIAQSCAVIHTDMSLSDAT